MNCERCGRREAAIKFIEIDEGSKRSRWLCEVCASEEGVQPPAESHAAGAADLQVFLDAGVADPDTSDEAIPPCAVCGTDFENLHGQGLLGCPACYEHFRLRLVPLLRRYHRATTHLGKAPTARGPMASRWLEIAQLRSRLEEAVSSEDFETAARLRDQIVALQSGLTVRDEETS